jgi:hypothetical protein
MRKQSEKLPSISARANVGGAPELHHETPPIIPLASSALLGSDVLVLFSHSAGSTHAPAPIGILLRQLGAETVREFSFATLFSPFTSQSFHALKEGFFGIPRLFLLSLRSTQIPTSILVGSLLVSFVARLTGREVLIYAPEVLPVYQSSWQQFLLRNLISLSAGILVSDQMELDQLELNYNAGRIVASPETFTNQRSQMQALRQIQPRVLALASTEEERRILRAIESRTRQKYPRAEVSVQTAGQRTSAVFSSEFDVALIVAPTSYSLEFIQRAIDSGLIPIVPQAELPGLVPGSGVALTVRPLDVEQTSNALCRLVEDQTLVASLRTAAEQLRVKQTPANVLQSWGDALHSIFAKSC